MQEPISKSTPIQLGMFLTALGVAFGFGFWMNGISTQLETQTTQLIEINVKLDGVITNVEFAQWVELLKARNSGKQIDIPGPPK